MGYSQEHITARVYTTAGSSICLFAKHCQHNLFN